MVRRLEAAGYQVTYASPKAVGAIAKVNGLTYQQLPPTNFFPAPDLPVFQGRFRKVKRLWYKIKYRKARKKQAVLNLGMTEFRQLLDELSPDLLLIDVELHEHLMTAQTTHIPMVLLSQWFSLWNRVGLPPLSDTTIPNLHWQGSKIGLVFAWQKIKVHRWWMFTKKRIRSVGTNRRSILKKYAQQIGFPKAYLHENYWPGPFTYAKLPVISMVLAEMEFPHDKRPNLHYVGAMIGKKRADVQNDKVTQRRLQAIFEIKKHTATALIYCTLSSFKQGDTAFLKRLIEAVKDREDWQLILGLGGQLDIKSLGELPANVHAFSWVPQMEVLAKANCSINHGGIHTINECIHFQVPMLVYSGKRSDQNGCAARVHYHGLGIMADKDKDDSTVIAAKIERVLTEQKYKNNLQKMHQHYRRYQSEQVLEQYIST